MARAVGIYVHVPFCIKKCPYCAFYKERLEQDKEAVFLENILSEIRLYAQRYGSIDVDTIFFGGGTPNIIKRHTFSQIIQAIYTHFNVYPTAEVSMEMNPGVHSKDKLAFFVSEGVNRISVGVQSFDQQVLEDYGRNHCVADTYQFLEDVRSVGIKNMNADIMFGHPNHSDTVLTHSLDVISNMRIQHVSLYGLTVHPGTPFFKQRLQVNQDAQGDQYRCIQSYLSAENYRQYEVSNFCSSDFVCKHNLKYWLLHPTIGLGPSAHSFFMGKRYKNAMHIVDYIAAVSSKLPKKELPVQWNDFISSRLRYLRPISFKEITDSFGINFPVQFALDIDHLNASGHIKVTDTDMVVTPKGALLLDDIICCFLS
jgi:oxygen-independent coproporphyrinogen III oxidase